jgi:hypothetical protein
MTKFLTFFVFLALLPNLGFGQEKYVEDENWLKGFQTEADDFPNLVYWQRRKFTLEDVANGKQRLNQIRKFAPENEWEGLYYGETGIGDNKFVWNEKGGFFSFYFYHELKSLNFGTAKNSSGFIELAYEKLPFSQIERRSSSGVKLIKVKINETHFLVPENRLRDFCESAAGLSTDLQDFNYYWRKEEDMRKEASGLPILPPEYNTYLRYPIAANIIRIGTRKVVRSESIPTSQEIHYAVTLNAGTDKNLRKNMNLFVKDLGEWIQLTKVLQKTSVGFINRDFDENNQEQCWDSEDGWGQPIPCKEIRIGMKAETKGRL